MLLALMRYTPGALVASAALVACPFESGHPAASRVHPTPEAPTCEGEVSSGAGEPSGSQAAGPGPAGSRSDSTGAGVGPRSSGLDDSLVRRSNNPCGSACVESTMAGRMRVQ